MLGVPDLHVWDVMFVNNLVTGREMSGMPLFGMGFQ